MRQEKRTQGFPAPLIRLHCAASLCERSALFINAVTGRRGVARYFSAAHCERASIMNATAADSRRVAADFPAAHHRHARHLAARTAPCPRRAGTVGRTAPPRGAIASPCCPRHPTCSPRPQRTAASALQRPGQPHDCYALTADASSYG